MYSQVVRCNVVFESLRERKKIAKTHVSLAGHRLVLLDNLIRVNVLNLTEMFKSGQQDSFSAKDGVMFY